MSELDNQREGKEAREWVLGSGGGSGEGVRVANDKHHLDDRKGVGATAESSTGRQREPTLAGQLGAYGRMTLPRPGRLADQVDVCRGFVYICCFTD
ncbi:hypothetical protein PoB_002322800 [Plakobranchus ocellatus]|uniref:Uncharacterized protein n=1 Tax=Plakobranchus ocellatus TaxID=259542 RepID=A0AAV3ZPF6_9GAST|nr:hypothetical protein PoB_002322800 [Plakobranchus ocellatus]